MATLQLEEALVDSTGHEGEVLSCVYLPDNTCLISAGWDGTLQFWDASQGAVLDSLPISDKPISACAVSADGRLLLTGTMDGLLGQWDVDTREQRMLFLAHTRPVSDIVFSPDSRHFASVSWDCSVHVWEVDQRLHQSWSLGYHDDIVSGCRFTPDGKRLLSWSYDGTAVLWDLASLEPLAQMVGHTDRLTAGAISPDGEWFVSGARNGEVKLWEMKFCQEAASLTLSAEIRSCFFLLDAQSLVLVDSSGRLTLCELPELQITNQLESGKDIHKAVLSPSGAQIALGCGDGHVHFATVEGFDRQPLAVTAARDLRTSATMLQRLLGQSRTVAVYQFFCPACRSPLELSEQQRRQVIACPHCHLPLRVCAVTETCEPAEAVIQD